MSTPTSTTRRAMRKARWIVPTLVIAPVLLGVMTAVPPAHASVGCNSSGCAGKDPQQMGCSTDAYTVESANYTYPGSGNYYEIDLRYSPACNANWARAVTDTSVPFCVKNNSNGDIQSYTTAAGQIASWTNMNDGTASNTAWLELPTATQSQNYQALYASDTPAAGFWSNSPC